MTGTDSPMFLRVWNCYAQDWLDGFATVFRFENDNLLVWNDIGAQEPNEGR